MLVKEMQTYYSKRAAEYDESMGYNDTGVVECLAPVISTLKALGRGRRVLELACGPAFWTQHVASVAESVKATDFNASTLEQARKKNLPWDRVSLAQADAYNLSAIPGEFNMVMAVDWLAHVPRSRIESFLDGVATRVPRGSQIAFVDQLPGPRSLSGVIDYEGNHIQERTLNGEGKFRVIKHFFDDEELYKMFSPISTDVRITRFPGCRRILVSATSTNSQQGRESLTS
ncbi:MAG TPA: class I SAM-dependent methyltransferase [Chthoniobacterales bacterium]